MQILHTLTNLEHHTSSLAADALASGVHTETDQHVTEVDTRGAHRHTHLSGLERGARLWTLDQSKVLQSVLFAGGQSPRRSISRQAERVGGGYRRQPRREQRAVADRDLRFLAGDRLDKRLPQEGLTIYVDQQETPRMLGLCRAHQSPDRCIAQIAHILLDAGCHRACAHYPKYQIRELRLDQPCLHELKCLTSSDTSSGPEVGGQVAPNLCQDHPGLGRALANRLAQRREAVIYLELQIPQGRGVHCACLAGEEQSRTSAHPLFPERLRDRMGDRLPLNPQDALISVVAHCSQLLLRDRAPDERPHGEHPFTESVDSSHRSSTIL